MSKLINSVNIINQDLVSCSIMSDIKYAQGYITVAVVGFYDEIVQIFENLLHNYNVYIGNIELTDYEWSNGYDDEYLLIIDENCEISIEPLKMNKDYLVYNGDSLYLSLDSDSEIVHKNTATPKNITYFGNMLAIG